MSSGQNIKIVTHGGKFHSDDVFAVATLFTYLGEENCRVVRSRDKDQIESGDYVVDIGQVYDSAANRFDHHQLDGAGKRDNGISYASFGLVWKKFGEEICEGDSEVSGFVDEILVQPIDAGDNGEDIWQPLFANLIPHTTQDVISLYRATWREAGDWDSRFLEAVHLAKWILNRQVRVAKDTIAAQRVVIEKYKQAEDKRLVILDEKEVFGRELVSGTLVRFSEPAYAILYRPDVGEWQVVAVNTQQGSYEVRKPFPSEWGAKSNEDLAAVSGVHDAIFCHRGLFMCVAKSKEGAIALAQKALEQNSE